MKMIKLARGLMLAAVAVSGTAHAGFILSGTGSTHLVPGINDFRTQLASNGVTSFNLGQFLSVTGANAGDTIEIDFFAAEAGYRNQFYWEGDMLINNQGNRSWSERDVATVSAFNGTQNFFFNTPGYGSLTNLGNDATVWGSYQSIGMTLTNNGNTAWLLWDDSGANMDDNHDDLIVRLNYRAAVPEPGTLALLGLGLAGMGLVRRRRQGA